MMKMSLNKLAVLAAIGFGVLNFSSTFANLEKCGCAEVASSEKVDGLYKYDQSFVEKRVAEARKFFNDRCRGCEAKPEFFLWKIKGAADPDNVKLMFSPSLLYSKYIAVDLNNVDEDDSDEFFEYGPECLGFQLVDQKTNAMLKISPQLGGSKKDRSSYFKNDYVLGFVKNDCVGVMMPDARFRSEKMAGDVQRDSNFKFVPGRTYTLKVFKQNLLDLENENGNEGRLLCETDLNLNVLNLEKEKPFVRPVQRFAHPARFDEDFARRYIVAQEKKLSDDYLWKTV